jgi:hypothetical protein
MLLVENTEVSRLRFPDPVACAADLGQQLRLASEQVIEGEFKDLKTPEIAPPSVTPSAELTS